MALHLATMRGDEEAMQELLDGGADPHLRDQHGSNVRERAMARPYLLRRFPLLKRVSSEGVHCLLVAQLYGLYGGICCDGTMRSLEGWYPKHILKRWHKCLEAYLPSGACEVLSKAVEALHDKPQGVCVQALIGDLITMMQLTLLSPLEEEAQEAALLRRVRENLGVPVVLSVRTQAGLHAVACLLCGDRVYYCDRIQSALVRSGVSIFRADAMDSQRIATMLRWSAKGEEIAWERWYNQDFRRQYLGEHLDTIPQSLQSVGNCSYTSSSALLFAMIYAHLQNKDPIADPLACYALAKLIHSHLVEAFKFRSATRALNKICDRAFAEGLESALQRRERKLHSIGNKERWLAHHAHLTPWGCSLNGMVEIHKRYREPVLQRCAPRQWPTRLRVKDASLPLKKRRFRGAEQRRSCQM